MSSTKPKARVRPVFAAAVLAVLAAVGGASLYGVSAHRAVAAPTGARSVGPAKGATTTTRPLTAEEQDALDPLPGGVERISDEMLRTQKLPDRIPVEGIGGYKGWSPCEQMFPTHPPVGGWQNADLREQSSDVYDADGHHVGYFTPIWGYIADADAAHFFATHSLPPHDDRPTTKHLPPPGMPRPQYGP